MRQQLDHIQLGQDDDITKLEVFEKQKPLGTEMHENGIWAHSSNVQNDPCTILWSSYTSDALPNFLMDWNVNLN